MATKNDKLKDLTDKLEQGIRDVYDSDSYKHYLATMSKFHSYSFRNSLLIAMQNPNATHVAGYTSWQKNFKRHVKKGEKGLQILAPTPRKITVDVEKIDSHTGKKEVDSNGNSIYEKKEIIKPAFRVAYVYDVSQTDGEPIPQLISELTGNVARYEHLYEALVAVSPFPIYHKEIKNGAKGYCDPTEKAIYINTGMSQVQTIKTATHEITHADLHAPIVTVSMDTPIDRRTMEVEAESVAYMICEHYGIDTSEYSFPYLASWSSGKELKELKSSLDRIQKQADELLTRIDERYFELLEKENQDLAKESLDTIRFDNEPDLDKEKSRENLGFKDNEPKQSIADRIKSAKEKINDQKELHQLDKEKNIKPLSREEI
jgi:hypothetical protein